MELQDELTVILHKPITRGSADTVTELKLREPSAGEISKSDQAAKRHGSSIAGELMLISLVSGIELPFVEKLCARDYHAASEFLNAFFNVPAKAEDPASPS